MADQHEKKVVWVDMTNDVAEEEGMVCGGTMKVLVESME
jgi:xanthine/CO dehydrogenase XdhC/CoxF family maturation factor